MKNRSGFLSMLCLLCCTNSSFGLDEPNYPTELRISVGNNALHLPVTVAVSSVGTTWGANLTIRYLPGGSITSTGNPTLQFHHVTSAGGEIDSIGFGLYKVRITVPSLIDRTAYADFTDCAYPYGGGRRADIDFQYDMSQGTLTEYGLYWNIGGKVVTEGEVIHIWDNNNGLPGSPNAACFQPPAPTNLYWTGSAGEHPTIHWSPITEIPISGYNVYKQDASEQWVLLNSSLITGNSWVDYSETILGPNEAGAVRYYHAKAVDQAAQESSPSQQVNVWVSGGAYKRGSSTDIPTDFALSAAFPNPFNPTTQLEFNLPVDGYVSLNVFDVLGRKVAEIANGNYAAGYHSATGTQRELQAVCTLRGSRQSPQSGTNGVVKFSKINKLIISK